MTGLEKSKVITEIIKNITQMIALIVAGLWAFSNFQDTEKPSLESRAHSDSVLEWYQSPESNRCLVSFGITVKNIGKKAIDFNNVSLRIWVVEQPPLDKAITYLEPEEFQSGKPNYEKSFRIETDNLAFLGHFAPDIEAKTDFTFSFEKQTSKIALFSFVANGQDVKIRERRWSYICDLHTQPIKNEADAALN